MKSHARMDELFAKPEARTERVLANIAAIGEFSSDGTVGEYLGRIWMPVKG